MIRVSIVFIALFTAGACNKKNEGGGGGGGGGTAKASEPAKPAGPTKLAKLGLQIDAPGSIEVGDAIGGEGHMLQGSSIGAMQIEVEDKPKSLDEEKSDADMYSPKNLKGETLSDGWALSFENKGGMGTNYFVTVRRDIDGKSYSCTTTGSDATQAAAVLAACKTLRK